MNRELIRRFGTLLGGTTVAQLIPLLAVPVIARSYETEEFGIFGLFLATTAILSTFANLKYETAILVAATQREARAILEFCVVVNLVLGTLIALALTVSADIPFVERFDAPPIYILLVPLFFIFSGIFQAFVTAALAMENFTLVARSRIISAASTSGISMIAALAHPTAGALMLASIIGPLAGIMSLCSTMRLREVCALDFRLSCLVLVGRKYWRFAVFTSPADLMNALASNLPTFFIGALYGNAVAGAYVLAQRIFGTPLMLIGSSFSDIYRQKVGKLATRGVSYWSITIRMTTLLTIIGGCILIAILKFGDEVSRTVLSDRWNLVGDILRIIVVVYVVRFVVSPITYTYYLANRHSEDLLLQFCSFALVLLIYYFGALWKLDLFWYLTIYSSALTLIYLTYGVRSLVLARLSQNVEVGATAKEF
jgi:O-antigen/teichoic acid export membrane protein